MASDCDVACFIKCALPMNIASGIPNNSESDLHSMARCMTHVCQLDYLDKNITELANVHQQLAMQLFKLSRNHSLDYSNCTFYWPKRVSHYELPRYAVPIFGYLSPIIIFLTLISNSLVCIVLMNPHMRTPTSVILVAIAISDTFTSLLPLPIFLHFYATQRLYELVPCNWCDTMATVYRLSIIFHTAAIWLTVALTVQRYICVCHPFKARTWCTIRNAIYGTVAIYIVSTLTNIWRFFEYKYTHTEIPSLLDPDKYVSACVLEFQPFGEMDLLLYYSGYYLFRAIFVNLLPCLSLVVMNALLINTLRLARKRRQQLLGQRKNIESRKLQEETKTTLMLVVVVCVFLLVELPVAFCLICAIMYWYNHIRVFETETFTIATMFINFFVYLSCPINFFIYCSLCKKFRDTFKQMFICRPKA